jgi:hypothetical protein
MKPMNRLKDSMNETRLEKKLKKQDQLELPMDEKFFESLHDRIMSSIEKTEVKPLSRWAQTWVFLETKAKPHRALFKKVVKTSFVGVTFSLALGLADLSEHLYEAVYASQKDSNQLRIVQEAEQNPTGWSDLIVSYQNENDFYADVLSQRNDLGTIVEIDRVLTQSL